ncbi:hsp70 family protein [Gigaspora margarita]|uniref:Hsp70 family protein n=1 Tax=Gigaspora margarita TaxID=4874 RepID=A0A8H4ACS7_GIGMA|nr:hsp70 family protein [Gigaspora margarita]
MIQQFCERVKTQFTGEESEFRKYSLDIEKTCPALKQYVSSSARNDKCTVMFLVEGFSESKYLQQRIKQRFSECRVAIPPYLMASIAHGAVIYGLDMDAIKNCILKWTYGVAVHPKFQEGDLSLRKQSDGRVEKFRLMAKKGIQVEVNQQFSATMLPNEPKQTGMLFKLYYTAKKTARFCDEPEMHKLGEFHVDLLDTHLGLNRPVILYLYFGAMEIIAIAKNETNGQVHRTIFKLDL